MLVMVVPTRQGRNGKFCVTASPVMSESKGKSTLLVPKDHRGWF